MPTYQYSCTDCTEQLEVRQSFTDDALTVCPSCEGRLRKVFNAVGVVFKGSGFYKTDSRAAAGSGKGDSGGESGKGDSGGTSEGSATEKSGASADKSTEKPSTPSKDSKPATGKKSRTDAA